MKDYASLLLSHPLVGALSVSLLFIISFLCVHIVRLVKFGWIYQRKKLAFQKSEPVPTPEKQAPKPQEPVYYIVERKKRRAKSSYGEPKAFRFKEQ